LANVKLLPYKNALLKSHIIVLIKCQIFRHKHPRTAGTDRLRNRSAETVSGTGTDLGLGTDLQTRTGSGTDLGTRLKTLNL